MARIRTVKPEYPKSRKTRRVSRDARLLNIHLWNLADDDGRLQELPRWIIGEIFPADDDVTPGKLVRWLEELQGVGLIVRYEVDGERYIYCHDWHEHQSISHPRPSELPAPPSPEELQEASRKAPGGNGTGKGREEQPLSSKLDGEAEVVAKLCEFWQSECRHPQAHVGPKTERYRKVRSRLRDGYTPKQIALAIRGAARAPFVNADGKRFDDLELICRSAEKLEDFMARAERRRGDIDVLEELAAR